MDRLTLQPPNSFPVQPLELLLRFRERLESPTDYCNHHTHSKENED
ncbi:hypothetical protein [Pseudanabaena minima]